MPRDEAPLVTLSAGPEEMSSSQALPAPRDEALLFTLSALSVRYLPELPPLPHGRSVLILGAGTLGCALSRALLAWGFTTLTFVDHGCVRPSNPTRQCLYTLADVGAPKAATAAAAIRALSPGANAAGHALSIPSPGRGELCLGALEALEQLIQKHNLIYLCTDTRESRWAPAFLCALHQRPCIAIGISFDGYVVIRHAPSSACYFCYDSACLPSARATPAPPTETCTLTRPGVASVAAAAGAELAAVLLCHPLGLLAPAEGGGGGGGSAAAAAAAAPYGPLGPAYNVLRGSLPAHTSTLAAHAPSPDCTACGARVQAGGRAWLVQVLQAGGVEALAAALLAQRGGSGSAEGSSSAVGGSSAVGSSGAVGSGGGGGGGGGGAAASAIETCGAVYDLC